MDFLNFIDWDSPIGFAVILIILTWELIWKGFALWKSARNNQFAWFFCIFIMNTLGILPIIYLLIHRKKK